MSTLNLNSATLSAVENLLKIGKTEEAWRTLRSLDLESWGELLWQMPIEDFPLTSAALPKMSPTAVQELWTGASGKELLNQTLPFMKYLLSIGEWTNHDWSSGNVLDYGCGYGRISRLMLKYVEIRDLFGADPWQESIDLAKDAGFSNNFKLTDEVPEELPFKENQFDLIWAFSVFTHLAPQVAFQSLETLSRYLKPTGNLVITLRPIEYWDLRTDLPAEKIEKFKFDHNTLGDAFLPHNRIPSEKYGVTYGDTSISLKKLEKNIGNLKVKDISGSEIDPFQIYVTLGL